MRPSWASPIGLAFYSVNIAFHSQKCPSLEDKFKILIDIAESPSKVLVLPHHAKCKTF